MTSWLIGSTPECDVVVDEQAVSGKHCRLTKKVDGFYLEDLQSTNGTYVNGQRLSSARRVSSADKITLGQKISLPWPAAASAAAERIVSIGQSADNDIVINHPAISGHHARLTIRGTKMELEDLGSTNGTFVGSTSQRIQKTAVQPDDRVFFGTHEIAFRKLLAASNIALTSGDAAKKPWSVTTPAASRPTAQAREVSERSAEKSHWNEYVLPAMAGTALLVICVVGVLMLLSSSNSEETSKSSQDVAERPAGNKNVQANSNENGSGVRVGFLMGKYHPDHVVEQIKVTIRVGAVEQDLKEPVDLDLGGGFLLRLSPVTTEVPTGTAVAFPQKSLLKSTDTTVAAGTEAWFEFSAEDEENSEGEFSTTPQVLADFSFDQISTIRFAAEGKTDWVLQGYEIQINGERFASHDSVNWRVKGQRREDQAELARLTARQKTLEQELAKIETYIQQGLGEASDERELQEKKKENADVAKAIKTLRESASGTRRSYVERNDAFRPGSSASSTQAEE